MHGKERGIMESKKSRRNVIMSSALTYVAVAGLLLVSVFGGGCQDSAGDYQSSSPISPIAEAASDVMVPTLADIEAVIDLAPEQREAFEACLARWRDAVAERMANRGHGMGNGPCGGVHGRWQGSGDGECDPEERARPVLGFLEEASDILDTGQFVALLQFLGDRMEAHRSAMGEAGGRALGDGEMRGHGAGRFGRKGEGPGMAGGERMEGLLEELDLSEEQKSQIGDARERMREAIGELRSQFTPGESDREELRDKMQALRDRFEEELRNILTAEQYSRLEELRAERRSEMEEKREERGRQMRERLVEFLTEVLDLSGTQSQQVSAILADAGEQTSQLHEKARTGEISREDARSELDRIRDETTEAMKQLLTPEQAEIFEALKDLIPGHGRPFGR
jgi:Spy/CpxP family protein refolding chaperone